MFRRIRRHLARRGRARRSALPVVGSLSLAVMVMGCGATHADPIENRTGTSGLAAGQPMHPKLTAATTLEIRLMTSPGNDEAHTVTDPDVVAQFAAAIDATSDQPAGSIPRGMETVWLSFTDATDTQLVTVHVHGDKGWVRDPEVRVASPAELASIQALLDAHVRK